MVDAESAAREALGAHLPIDALGNKGSAASVASSGRTLNLGTAERNTELRANRRCGSPVQHGLC
jgi:hypothetical protein